MNPLLEIRNLKKYFPVRKGVFSRVAGWVRAVDDVSFDVAPGETLGLVGESGCGKTTLGRTLLRLVEPTSGEVRYDGSNLLAADAAEMRRRRRDLQIIFQDPYSSLNPRMTVGAIVCDEPVSALDVSVQSQVVNLLVELKEKYGIAYLFISHDLSVVQYISDRVAVMYVGQIVETATSEELYRRPLHPYTKALLSAVPMPDPDRKRTRILLEGDVPSPMAPPPGCRFHPRCPVVIKGVCETQQPAMIDDNGHKVACHAVERELKGS